MVSRTNRRSFLRRSAAYGAGLWIVGSGSRLLARAANEAVNVACIGVGGQGNSNLTNIAKVPNVNIVGLCDVDRGSLGKAADKHKGAATFDDFRRMLDEKHKEIDAVVVSTPDHFHAVAAVAAMKLGKGVYCEKPLCHSIHEARALAEVAAASKVATQMGNQGHSGDGARRIVEIVRAGDLGAIKEVHTWTNRPIWKQGEPKRPEAQPVPEGLNWDVWLGPAAERAFNKAYHPFAWRGFWDFGTGALGDMACHLMDAPYWALDLKNPTSVEMVAASGSSPEMGPAWSITEYHFPARGGLEPLKLTWYEGGKRPPEELIEGEKMQIGGSILVGEKGKLYITNDYAGGFTLLPKKQFLDYKRPEATLPRVTGGHHGDFVKAVKDRSHEAASNFAYATGLTETVLLGVLAQRVGKKIEWDAAKARVTNLSEAEEFIRPTYRKGWSLG